MCVVTLLCNRCKNIWQYKGSNPYCANCSRCKSTVFIKKSSISPLSKTPIKKEIESSQGKVTKNIPVILKE